MRNGKSESVGNYLAGITGIFFFLWGTLSLFGQECITSDISISKLSGKVELGNGTSISKIKIQLRAANVKQTLLSTVRANEVGEFNFAKRPAGSFLIVVEDVKGLNNLTVKVNLSYRKKGKKVGLRIIMASLFGEDCSRGEPFELAH